MRDMIRRFEEGVKSRLGDFGGPGGAVRGSKRERERQREGNVGRIDGGGKGGEEREGTGTVGTGRTLGFAGVVEFEDCDLGREEFGRVRGERER